MEADAPEALEAQQTGAVELAHSEEVCADAAPEAPASAAGMGCDDAPPPAVKYTSVEEAPAPEATPPVQQPPAVKQVAQRVEQEDFEENEEAQDVAHTKQHVGARAAKACWHAPRAAQGWRAGAPERLTPPPSCPLPRRPDRCMTRHPSSA
jgi:hypothetical protein